MDVREIIRGLLDYISELEGEIDEARCSPPAVLRAQEMLDGGPLRPVGAGDGNTYVVNEPAVRK